MLRYGLFGFVFILLGALNAHNVSKDAGETTEFVWNYAIIAACDVCPETNLITYFHAPSCFDKSVYKDVKEGDVVWVKPSFLSLFCEQALPEVKHPFILVTSVGDQSFPTEYGPGFDIEKLLSNDKIIHVFAQNCTYSGPSNKVSHIPIGLDFETIAYRDYWGEEMAPPSQQEGVMKDILQGLQPTYLRKKLAYVDFQLNDTMRHENYKRYLQCREDRTSIFNRLLTTNLIDYGVQTNRSMLWKIKGQYAFSISPHGNGLDCHRTWEDLALGCIVIVKTSPLDPMYEGLPVVIVEDWSEITEQNMEIWLDLYGDAFTHRSYRKKLTSDYWIQRMKSVKSAYLKKSKEKVEKGNITPKKSELDQIIPGQICNDPFYDAIYTLARTQPIKTILEIGSSNGEGSTQAFVTGLRQNPNKPLLYCMEVSEPRCAALKKHYEYEPSVICYNVSSVPLYTFPQEYEVSFFYRTIHTTLNAYPLEMVISWLRQDIEYVKSHNVPENGIELIKKENGITDFDVVLIDGSEFTGTAELDLVYGAKFILLDDINAFKNYYNHQRLLKDSAYELIEEHFNIRNGYSIFGLKNR